MGLIQTYLAGMLKEVNNTKTIKPTKVSKKPRKSLAVHFSVRRGFKIAAICGLVLFIVAQLAFDMVTFRRLNGSDDTTVFTLIGQAVDNLNKPAPVDPASGAVYLTDAKLRLPPAPQPLSQVLYSYSNWDNGADAELHVTTQQAIGTAKSRMWSAEADGTSNTADRFTRGFEQVPRLQACSRGITVLFSAQPAASYQVKPENIKQLKDGRTMYIATDDVTKCDNGTLTSLVDYVKQAESY